MQLRYGLLAEFEAAPGKGDALAAFLTTARETAGARSGHRHLVRVQDQRHDVRDIRHVRRRRRQGCAPGRDIPVALAAMAPRLLAAEPTVRTIDIVAFK